MSFKNAREIYLKLIFIIVIDVESTKNTVIIKKNPL